MRRCVCSESGIRRCADGRSGKMEGQMKIKIVNFGPLKEFEFDLSKRFIAIYGNNNIGKSYSMQAVYLLLKTFIGFRNSSAVLVNGQPYPGRSMSAHDIGEILQKLLRSFVETDMAEKDITNEVRQILHESISEMFMPHFMNACGNTFGNFQKLLEKNPHI